jgi:hypothetical protein
MAIERAFRRTMTTTVLLAASRRFNAAAAMRDFWLRLVALIGALCLSQVSANAVNMSDTPANRSLDEHCGQIGFLGPIITAYCFDKDNVPYKSKIDVRTCVDLAVTVTPSARLACKYRRH